MFVPSFQSFFTTLFSFLALVSVIRAQEDAPLFVQGGLEDATATDGTFNTGGRIVVNGFDILVPKNLQVQFPAAWVGFREFAAEKQSLLGYEVNVIGNFVDGQGIAAQIIAYEFAEGLASGYIESINVADGTMQIQAGPTLRISDPNAVFSKGFAGAPFFTADDQNPSISSFSGFPMCIPRNSTDPLCPASNRPRQGAGTYAVRDPLVMAPFLPGDFVTFSGIRRNNEVICFSIVAQNIQITTPGELAYARVEEVLLGIANDNPNTEVAESRVIGFTSNSRATIAVYAIDYDACTGAATDRIIAAVSIDNREQNRFRYRQDILSGYARDYRVVTEISGVPKTRLTKNGILAGTYASPVTVWVHAEQAIPGTQPIAHDFSQMPWLTRGIGRDANGDLWGPLDPFPQTGLSVEAPDCSSAGFAPDEEQSEASWEPSSWTLGGEGPPKGSAINTTATWDESEIPAKRSMRHLSMRWSGRE